MYRLEEELDAVLALQSLVGQRRHGHFDHDSHGVTGTSGNGTKKSVETMVQPASCQETVRAVIKLKRDEKTGAFLRA
jgi:hypothetical protein